LLHKDSIEDSDRIKSFLIRLEGSFASRQNIDVESAMKSDVSKITMKIRDHLFTEEINHSLVVQYMTGQGMVVQNVQQHHVA
jgi:hypothetical protein